MPLLRPARKRQEELLDHDAGTPEEIDQSLDDLRRINRYLGGYRVSLRAIDEFIRSRSARRFTLLDVATGGADLPVEVVRWARRRHLACQVTALDLSDRHLEFAQRHVNGFSEIQLLRADVRNLPFPSCSFDLVNASLFIHHLDDSNVAGFLRSLYSLARWGLIINDLERHRVPYAILKIIQPAFARSRITRFDSFASLRQAFTAEELEAHANATGVPGFRVKKHFPFRLALVMSRNHTH